MGLRLSFLSLLACASYGRAAQRQKLVTKVCALRVLDGFFSDKKALSRIGEREGLCPSQKTPRQRACVSTLSVREQSEAHSLFSTQAHGKAVRNGLETRYGVSVTLTLMFYEYTTNFLVIKRRCRAKGGCGGF